MPAKNPTYNVHNLRRLYQASYAQADTRMALREARNFQVHPFCITVDPDGESGYGGQIQCVAWAGGNQSEFANWVFVDTPAGPTDATAVEEDSWARIKTTFVQ